MLLRYFVNLYDMEIIEEEAFLSWKEDVNEEYPGKGKALFQVILFYSIFQFSCRFSSASVNRLEKSCSMTSQVVIKINLTKFDLLKYGWFFVSGTGESVADLAGDCRGRGIRRWRLLRNGPKPCVIVMQRVNLFFPCNMFCLSCHVSSPLQLLQFIHYEMSCQIKPASTTSYLYF